jgi:hypothetical protein
VFDPQIPSRQERLKVSVGSISFLILMSASRLGQRKFLLDRYQMQLSAGQIATIF